MLRKVLLGAAAAAAIMVSGIVSAQADTVWMAYAVNQRGDSYFVYNDDSEGDAKQTAIDQCQDKWARDCSQSTSVPQDWYLVVARCVNGDGDVYYSTGSSQYGYPTAANQAKNNANSNSDYWFDDGDCRVIREDIEDLQ